MGPLTLKLFAAADDERRCILSKAMHINIEPDFRKVLNKIRREIKFDSFNWQMMLPARCVVLEYSDVVIIVTRSDCGVFVELAATTNAEISGITLLVYPNTNNHRISPELARIENEAPNENIHLMLEAAAINADLLFSLLNEPRLVKKTPPRRAQIKQAKRALGANMPVVWTRISWTVGEKTIPKNSTSSETYRMPLHFCRGGWMYLAPGKIGSDWCPIKNRWKTWRKHAWKGHPDYGVKLHIYSPNLEPDGVSDDIINLVRTRATKEAKTAAIRAWEDQGINKHQTSDGIKSRGGM